jgi:rhodanese-related sulfurtransferase
MAVTDVTPEEVAALLAKGARLIDVREQDEWDNGHIAEAEHLPLAEVPDHVADFDASTLIICTCRSGGRSGRAAAFLDESGLTVANLVGGMQAWQAAALPMVGLTPMPFVE